MESPAEREARIRQLEAQRAGKQAEIPGGTVWPTPDDAGMGVVPIEIAPGRGDLQYSSGFIPTYPTALALINRTVSFARLFQSQPWVAAAVMRMLSWAIRVPLHAYERDAGEFTAKKLGVGEHPLADMIAKPWPGGSSSQLVMSLLGPVLIHGNSVTVVDDSHYLDGVIGLKAKDWRYAQPLMPWRQELDGFRFDVDAPRYTSEVSINKVLHICWWSPTGPIGTSPLMQLGVSLNVEDAAQRFQLASYRHGGRPPSAVVASEAFLGINPKERRAIMAQIRQDMIELYGGPENAGRPALLPPGLDWKAIGSSSVEAELVEQRKIVRDEIAAVYGIPPPLLGIMERATYANIGIQREMTYTDVMGPPLILIEQAINSQIVRDLLQEDSLFVQFDFGAVLRGDRLQEIEALRSAIGTALMTPNEARTVLNMESSDIDGMDTFWLPANNMQPVEKAASAENVTPASLQPFTQPAAPGPSTPEDQNKNPNPSPWEAQPDNEEEAPQKGRKLFVPDHIYETMFR